MDARPFEVRLATAADLTFIDHLQKRHGDQVGFLATDTLRANLLKGNVWIGFENGQPGGYVLGKPWYRGKETDAIVFQACVQFDAQRRQLGWCLVERFLGSLPAYTRRCSCWCAQDIEANFFWQAIDFLPLAYRAGGHSKGRVHIYWQRLLNQEAGACDNSYPSSTAGGAMKACRTVHRLEPGHRWDAVVRPADTADVRTNAMEGGSQEDVNLPCRRERKRVQRVVTTVHEPRLPKDMAERAKWFQQKHLGHGLIVAGRARPLPRIG